MWLVMVHIGDEDTIVVKVQLLPVIIILAKVNSLRHCIYKTQLLKVDTPLSTFIFNQFKVFKVDFCMAL